MPTPSGVASPVPPGEPGPGLGVEEGGAAGGPCAPSRGGGSVALRGRGCSSGVCQAQEWAFSSPFSHFLLRPQEQEVLSPLYR